MRGAPKQPQFGIPKGQLRRLAEGAARQPLRQQMRTVPKDYGAMRDIQLAQRAHRPLSERQEAVLALFEDQTLSHLHVAERLGLKPSSASTVCYCLSARGLLRKTAGGWVKP